jgi:hypothetical protein
MRIPSPYNMRYICYMQIPVNRQSANMLITNKEAASLLLLELSALGQPQTTDPAFCPIALQLETYLDDPVSLSPNAPAMPNILFIFRLCRGQ